MGMIDDDCSGRIGVVITASHNPPQDNGLKIIGSDALMLPEHLERIAEEFVNSSSMTLSTKSKQPKSVGKIFIGRDTRPSGLTLLNEFIKGFQTIQTQFPSSISLSDLGIITTPELHSAIASGLNESAEIKDSYLKNFTTSFTPSKDKITIDCANGVGSLLLKDLKQILPDFKLKIINNATEEASLLNKECGADYVKMMGKLPTSFDPSTAEGSLCASLDGDSDRLILYTVLEGKFHLFDGDRIACLWALVFKEIFKNENITIGVVQTAYANGSSTAFLEDHGIPVKCSSTGVKNLHPLAVESWDIGVYFEANGHGTCVYSDRVKMIEPMMSLSNQYVGDAIGDLLLTISILSYKNWGVKELLSLYEDLPNKQTKIVVKDRSIYRCTDSDRRLMEPLALQQDIDALLSKTEGSRAFIRPSGTEDCIRVYVESPMEKDVLLLSQKIGDLVLLHDS